MNHLREWYKVNFKSSGSDDDISAIRTSIVSFDKLTIYRGYLSDKYGFLIIIIINSMGLSCFLTLPTFIRLYGGGVFIFFNIFISFLFILPMYLLEMGLGQFYSRTTINVFQIVPLFKGLGFSMLLMNLMTIILYSSAVNEFLMFFVYSIFSNMPWKNCQRYPTINCTHKFSNSSLSNKLPIFLTPIQIFYDIDITGSRNFKDGLKYVFEDGLSSIRYPFFFCLITIWILVALLTIVVLRLFTKYLVYFLSFNLLILLILIGRMMFLPGSLKSLLISLSPNIEKCFSLVGLRNSMTLCLYSASIGYSTVTTIASLNKFRYNFYESIKITIISKIVFGIFGGVMEFLLIGFINFSNSKVKNTMENVEFSTLIDAISKIKYSTIWIILYTLLLMNVGISNIAIALASDVWSFIDRFPQLFDYSEIRKFSITIILTIILCFFSLFFSLRGSYIYYRALLLLLQYFTAPVLILLEIIAVFFIYGGNRFRSEVKMMLGFSFNCFWLFSGMTIIPLFLLISIIYSTFTFHQINIHYYLLIISITVNFLIFVPIFVEIFNYIHAFSKSLTIRQLLNKLITPLDYLGPYYKENWLFGKIYPKKLLKLKSNPEFLKTVRDTENLDEIIEKLTEKQKLIQIQKIQRKEALKKIMSSITINT